MKEETGVGDLQEPFVLKDIIKQRKKKTQPEGREH